jgi:glycerate kinase
MPLRVLVVPDKFKGTLAAPVVARAIARGWHAARPKDLLQLLPMSDGGDGFGEIISRLLNARAQAVGTLDAAHRRIRARWWWARETHTAVIESARVIGLAMLPSGRYHPFDLDTAGLARVLQAAAQRGCRTCLIGVGGSATNDGGFGLVRALGWRFLDRDDRPIERWTNLHTLARIVQPAQRPLNGMRVIVALDVQNKLLGPRGASRVYGPQKGLRPEDFPVAERCLGRLALIARKQGRNDYARVAGAGAAGGLGFGLLAFLRARGKSGIQMFARYAGLDRRLTTVDLVITGEGAMDKSTLMGKGVGEVARRCRKLKVPCLGLAGALDNRQLLRQRFAGVHCLTPELTTPQQAKAKPGPWLERLASAVAARWRGA